MGIDSLEMSSFSFYKKRYLEFNQLQFQMMIKW